MIAHGRSTGSNRRRQGLSLIVGFTLAMGAVSPALAAESGTVPGTVTVEQAVACLLVDGAYDFGTQPFSEPATFNEGHRSATNAAITNCGTDPQDVLVRGTEALGDDVPPSSWTLGPLADGPCSIDTYGVGVLDADVANTGRTFASLMDAPFASLSAGGNVNAAADLYMPCTGSNGAGETMTFSIVYTAILAATPPAPTEMEPNDDGASANLLTLDASGTATAYGAIDPVGDLDMYSVMLPGGIVSIETLDGSGNPTCVGIDTLVRLIGPGNALVAQDDDSGINTCSLATAVIGAPGGTYTIEVSDWGNDSVIAGYGLQVRLVDPL